MEADVAPPGVVLVGDVELVRGAVGAAVRGGPLVEVRAGPHKRRACQRLRMTNTKNKP